MGFLSKKKDDGDEGNRNALFGSRKKSEKATPQSNPCTSLPSTCNDTSNAQQTPLHPARTRTRNRRRNTPGRTTDTARRRRLP